MFGARRPATSGPSNASSLLQRVSTQLSGGKVDVTKSTAGQEDDDGLGDYLKTLSKKPTAKTELQWDKFGELSDLSDIETKPKHKSNDVTTNAAAATASSKFLKKKPVTTGVTAAQQQQQQSTKPDQASRAVVRPSSSLPVTSIGRSSALDKVQSFTSRYGAGHGSGSKAAAAADISDSDLDMDLSPDEEVLADVRASKSAAAANKQQPTMTATKTGSLQPAATGSPNKVKPVPQVVTPAVSNAKKSVAGKQSVSSPKHSIFRSANLRTFSDNEDEETSKSSSVGIGKSGNKFIKKRVEPSPPPEVTEVVLKPEVLPATKGKASVTKPLSPIRKPASSAAMVALDTDDESLAEFMGGLSSSSSNHGKKVNKVTAAPNSPMKRISPIVRRTPTPRSLSIESDHEDTTRVSSEESVSDAESDHFRFNIKDINSLESDSEPDRFHDNKSINKTKLLAKDSEKKLTKSPQDDIQQRSNVGGRGDTKNNEIFSQLGLHTIDELMDQQFETASRVSSEMQYESDFDSSRVASPAPLVTAPLRSILSLTPRSLTPKSSRSRVRLVDDIQSRSRSPSPVPTARSSEPMSLAEVPTEVTSSSADVINTARSAATVPSDDEPESIATNSEVTVVASDSEIASSRRQRQHRRSSRSSRRSSEPVTSARSRGSRRSSRKISEASYTEDFTSTVTADETTRTRDEDEDVSQVTATSDADSLSSSSPTHRHHRHHRPSSRVSVRDTAVQTGIDVGGLHYSWPAAGPQSVADVQYGLAFVDPASIAATVVSADALEAMTAYTPSAVALNDLVRQQLQLTQQFISVQTRLHRSLIESLSTSAAPYHYTTLQDTEQYIRQHRRRVITFEEALKEVQQEMGLA